MNKSKFVENYFVEYYDSDIIMLLFNTTERWVNYHQYCDHQYKIGANLDDEFDDKDLIHDIPKNNLKLKEGVFYMNLVQQNKDQILFYFVPFHLITNGKLKDKMNKRYKKSNH